MIKPTAFSCSAWARAATWLLTSACRIPICSPVCYWANAQYLPLYIVGGDHTGAPDKTIRKLFETWVPHNYPALFVEYKGRGLEWFGGEVPYLFDWMSRKRRNTPVIN